MESYIVIILVALAFFVGKFFPAQRAIKKITNEARRNAFHEVRARIHRASELCGTYTCLSIDTRRLPLYPNGVTALHSVVLSNENGGFLKISCDREVAPAQKVSVQLRNPTDTPPYHSEGFGDLLEVIPIQAS